MERKKFRAVVFSLFGVNFNLKLVFVEDNSMNAVESRKNSDLGDKMKREEENGRKLY